MIPANLAVDIGMTNIDLILETEHCQIMRMMANKHHEPLDQMRQALGVVEDYPVSCTSR